MYVEVSERSKVDICLCVYWIAHWEREENALESREHKYNIIDCAALILVGLFKQWPNCMHGVKFCEIEFNELGCLLKSRSVTSGIFASKYIL